MKLTRLIAITCLVVCVYIKSLFADSSSRYFKYNPDPDVEYIPVDHNSFKLKIKLPNSGNYLAGTVPYYEDSAPNNYAVLYFKDNEEKWTTKKELCQNINVNSVSIENLKADTSYYIAVIGVTACNDINNINLSTKSSKLIKTYGPYPTGCVEPDVYISSDCNEVDFEFQKIEGKCKMAEYNMDLYQKNDHVVMEKIIEETNIKILRLEPQTPYVLRLTKGDKSKNLTFSTSSCSKEDKFKYTEKNNDIELFWAISTNKRLNYTIEWSYSSFICKMYMNPQVVECDERCNTTITKIPNVVYAIKLTVPHSQTWQLTFQTQPGQTKGNQFDQNFRVNYIEPEKESIKVYFSDVPCKELNKPVYITYNAYGRTDHTCCNAGVPRRIQFHFVNPLVIDNLSPNCEYVIKFVLSRDDRDDRLKLETTANTTSLDEVIEVELPDFSATGYNDRAVIINYSFKCSRGPLHVKYRIFHDENPNPLQKTGNTFLSDNSFVINGLQPDTDYRIELEVCRQADCKKGRRTSTDPTAKTKHSVVAGNVTDLLATSQGPKEISLRWLPANDLTQEIKEYRIILEYKLQMIKAYTQTKSDSQCIIWRNYDCTDIEVKGRSIDKITVVALYDSNSKEINDQIAKSGPYSSVSVSTKESEPEPPYNIRAYWSEDYFLQVRWNHPNQTNGVVDYFEIQIIYEYSNNSGSKQNLFDHNIYDKTFYKYEYHYTPNKSFNSTKKLSKIILCIKTKNQGYFSKCKLSDLDIEPLVPKKYTKNIKFDGSRITIPPPDFDGFFEKMHLFLVDANIPKESAEWEIKKISDQLKTGDTPKSEDLYQYMFEMNRSNTSDVKTDVKHTIKQGIRYKLTLFIINELNSIRKITIHSVLQSGQSHDSTDTTIEIVLFILFIIVVLMGCVLWRLKHKIFSTAAGEGVVLYSTADDTAPLTYYSNSLAGHEEPVFDIACKTINSKRINIQNLASYIKLSIESNELLRQHQLFPKYEESTSNKPRLTCKYSTLPQNRAKNRYNNIITYDHTLVKLPKIPGDECSDYINANYINGYKMLKAYIATQGPMANTVDDFWTMIWINNVKFIVMLTNLYDNGKKKCEQYWPNDEKDFLKSKSKIIRLIEVTTHPTYTERTFKVESDGMERKICQIHFTVWPSIGEPLFPQTLVPLLQKMLTFPYKSQAPIVIHCSAGIGRTGTILLCDISLRMAAAEGAVDMLKILEKLRNQRPNLVDNVEQYKLAHLAVLAALTAWNTSIKYDANFEITVDSIIENYLSVQMDYIDDSEWQDDAMKTVATAVRKHVPIPPEKNRYADILPDELCQILLKQLPDKGSSSCYINAIYVNSYHLQKRYIVTQHPLPETLNDFWRLVVEQQSAIIVNLDVVHQTEKASVPFWPKHGILHVENARIEYIKKMCDNEMSIYTLWVVHNSNSVEQRFKIEIVNFNHWSAGQLLPNDLAKFVSFVVDVATIGEKCLPIIVTCHDGATASGLFVALSNVIEQLEEQKICDVCQTIRAMRIHRKQFVKRKEQLQFLYNAVVEYSKNIGTYDLLNTFRK